MKKIALASALIALFASATFAQDVTNPTPPMSTNGAYNASPPTCVDGHGCWFQTDINGNLKTVASGTPSAIVGQTGTLTNRSGTVATGGTAQTLAAVNATRKYLFVENPCAQTESLWINFTTAAVASQPSIEIAPCGSFLMASPNFVSTELVSVIAATSAHPFIAKEN